MPRLRYLTAAAVLVACLSMVLSWAVPAFAAAPVAATRTAGAANAPADANARRVPVTGGTCTRRVLVAAGTGSSWPLWIRPGSIRPGNAGSAGSA